MPPQANSEPLAAISTLEAVRAVRGWPAGDEPGGQQ